MSKETERKPGERKEFHTKLWKTPKEIISTIITASEAKSKVRIDRLAILSILAGIYIGFGGQLSLSVAGGITSDPWYKKFVAGATFPIGLCLIVIAGGELFTGNVMFMAAGLAAKKITWKDLAINWTVVYIGNFAGTLIAAGFFAYLSDLMIGDPWLTYTHTLVANKMAPNWGIVLLRGIPCNMLVCLAIYLAIASEDIISKIIGIWFPICTFIASGFEHSIANMFFISTGIFYGADTGYGTFLWRHLLPVTIGNIIGGCIVGLSYWYLYVLEFHNKQQETKQQDVELEEPN